MPAILVLCLAALPVIALAWSAVHAEAQDQAPQVHIARPPASAKPGASPQRAKPGAADNVAALNAKLGKTELPEAKSAELRHLILEAVGAMPDGGGYRTSAESLGNLGKAIRPGAASGLQLNAEQAKPSFCSAATYLVFLSVLDRLHREGRLPMDEAVVNALLVKGQPDGVGVWGRWNANGPGTARLFHELQIGRNFTSFEEAREGDFLKIFWTDKIGSKEFGHSVVYLGTETAPNGEQIIRYWSSNRSDGYGVGRAAKKRIRRALFSRLENLRGISRVAQLPPRDDYLASMLKREGTEKEMLGKVGIMAAKQQEQAWKQQEVETGAPAAESREAGQLPTRAGSTPAVGGASQAETSPVPGNDKRTNKAEPAKSPGKASRWPGIAGGKMSSWYNQTVVSLV